MCDQTPGPHGVTARLQQRGVSSTSSAILSDLTYTLCSGSRILFANARAVSATSASGVSSRTFENISAAASTCSTTWAGGCSDDCTRTRWYPICGSRRKRDHAGQDSTHTHVINSTALRALNLEVLAVPALGDVTELQERVSLGRVLSERSAPASGFSKFETRGDRTACQQRLPPLLCCHPGYQDRTRA